VGWLRDEATMNGESKRAIAFWAAGKYLAASTARPCLSPRAFFLQFHRIGPAIADFILARSNGLFGADDEPGGAAAAAAAAGGGRGRKRRLDEDGDDCSEGDEDGDNDDGDAGAAALGKRARLCGVCREDGHTRSNCPSTPAGAAASAAAAAARSLQRQYEAEALERKDRFRAAANLQVKAAGAAGERAARGAAGAAGGALAAAAAAAADGGGSGSGGSGGGGGPGGAGGNDCGGRGRAALQLLRGHRRNLRVSSGGGGGRRRRFSSFICTTNLSAAPLNTADFSRNRVDDSARCSVLRGRRRHPIMPPDTLPPRAAHQ